MSLKITRREALKALALGVGVTVVAPHFFPGILQRVGTATRIPLKARALVLVSLELLEDGAFPAESVIRKMVENQAEHFGRQEGRTFRVTDLRRLDQRWVDLTSYEDEDGVFHQSYPGQGVFLGELVEVV